MKINELNINGKTYAKYGVEQKTIYLAQSRVNKLRKENDISNEVELITIIQLIEEKKFTSIAYLNLKDF